MWQWRPLSVDKGSPGCLRVRHSSEPGKTVRMHIQPNHSPPPLRGTDPNYDNNKDQITLDLTTCLHRLVRRHLPSPELRANRQP
jgi:hypothetical protein